MHPALNACDQRGMRWLRRVAGHISIIPTNGSFNGGGSSGGLETCVLGLWKNRGARLESFLYFWKTGVVARWDCFDGGRGLFWG